MITKEEIKKLEGQQFYSETLGRFVDCNEELAGVEEKIDNAKTAIEQVKDVEFLLRESKTKYRLQKRTNHAFGKDIFLLGRGTDNKLMWLEAPKWDCGWYWGFGYIETYTNENPKRAKDINSHSHFSGLVGAQEYYDINKQCWCKGEYIHNVYDSPKLIQTTFTSKEGWKLSELFAQFYLLKSMAEFTHKDKPGCHITESPVDHGTMTAWYNHINQVMIPKITAEICRMLTPVEEKKNENNK